MSDNETVSSEQQASGVVGYEPETPFALDGVGKMGAPMGNPTSAAAAFRPSYETESPFASEYESVADGVGPKAELYAEVVSELESEEFEEAVTDLVHEAAALAEDRFSYERGTAAQEGMEAEHGLREYLEPLASEMEALVDRVAESVRGTDLSTMSEGEFENFMEGLTPADSGLSPTQETVLQEFFLGKIKGALNKVRSIAQKFSPIHIIMNKLKTMARPLLEKVLRQALDRLPVAVRPIARQLASKFLGTQEMEGEDEEVGETAAADPAAIAREFDAQLAGYMMEGEEFERHVALEQFAAEQGSAGSDTIRELQERRAEFARDISELAPGQEAGPVVERFIPAILAALKLGIKIIGRPKVVNFLAGLVAKLIDKYVGKDASVTLSRSLVDTGLGFVGLEAPVMSENQAGYALASTLEDTIARVTQEAPASAWEDEEVLESYVREAFGKAASAHFPDSEIRSDLHEASKVSGAWVALPVQNRRKHYKKYSRPLEVSLTAQMAAALKSFGGVPVQAVLRDQLGLAPNGPLPVRVHLYEAVPGASLPDIATHEKHVRGLGSNRREAWSLIHPLTPEAAGILLNEPVPGASLPDIATHEKHVRGLGSNRREAWSLIHPLTPEAAGILLNEPGLGRPVDPKFLADRNVITVGQRFYYLETQAVRPRTIVTARGVQRSPRTARIKVHFDFPRGELRVMLFFSEAQAQAIAAQLRGRAPGSVTIAALKSGLDTYLATLFSGAPTRALRIIHERAPIENFQSPLIGGVLKIVGRPLASLTLRWVLETFKRELVQRREQFAAQFTRAAASEEDGVSVVIVFQRPSFFQQLRGMLSGRTPLAAAALGAVLTRQAVGEYTLSIHPGYPRWSQIRRPAAFGTPTAIPVMGATRAAGPMRPAASQASRPTTPPPAPRAAPAPSPSRGARPAHARV